jgi:UDP-N-acetylmuramoylalanine--D-glutamate ligase
VELAGKEIVVVGLARSGLAAAEFLAQRGAHVLATDRKREGELSPAVLRLAEMGVRLDLGGHREAAFTSADLVVVSPGVPWELPELASARGAGVPVMAELELASRHLRGSVAAVTGTKGKSTTTAVLGAMVKEAGRDVRVGGNIGEPLIGMIGGSTEDTVFVVEVSSFQLQGTESFRPDVAVFLNLSADHLDRHASFEEYAQAKAMIFRNQRETDWAVVNADDARVLSLAREARARLLRFSPVENAQAVASGDAAYYESGKAWLRLEDRAEPVFARSDVRLPGEHLAGDVLAAAAAARLLGVPADAVEKGVRGFSGIEHVLERVAVVNGVSFFNDSKATNVDATRRSLEAFSGPVLAIMGGRYKGGDFRDLHAALGRHGKAVFAIGEAKERIGEALASVLPVFLCGSLQEAVDLAWAQAEPGDAVVLAPACSSFDMFEDYAQRGRLFKEAVARLVAGSS